MKSIEFVVAVVASVVVWCNIDDGAVVAAAAVFDSVVVVVWYAVDM